MFVTGMPRTGTTALHRLLCRRPGPPGPGAVADARCRSRARRARRGTTTRCSSRSRPASRSSTSAKPEFMGVHYISADMVEECWQLLRQSMRSHRLREPRRTCPTYSAWLAAQDWTPAYARHRRNLQLIGSNERGKRWVLKNPSHLFALDALLAVYPGRAVVQTHREIRTHHRVELQPRRAGDRGLVDPFVGDDDRPRPARDAAAAAPTLFMPRASGTTPRISTTSQYDDLVRRPDRHRRGDVPTFRPAVRGRIRARWRSSPRTGQPRGRPGTVAPLRARGLGPDAAEVDDRFAEYSDTYLTGPSRGLSSAVAGQARSVTDEKYADERSERARAGSPSLLALAATSASACSSSSPG